MKQMTKYIKKRFKNETTYYITEIRDYAIKHGLANDILPSGKLEIPSKFDDRHDAYVTANASTFDVNTGGLRGVVIKDGKILQNDKNITGRTYLTFDNSGKMWYAEHSKTGEEMLKMGVLIAYPFEDKSGTCYKNTKRSGIFRGWVKC